MRIFFEPDICDEDALAYVERPDRFGVRRCTCPFNEFTVHYNGDVSSCLSLRIDNMRNLGYDVKRVIRHPRYREFLKTHCARMPYARACEGCASMKHTRKPL
jgi:radical SAM protein with 4Fe4S-binding SPASM domain